MGSHLADACIELGAAEVSVYDDLSVGRLEHLSQARSQQRVPFHLLRGDVRDVDALHTAMQAADLVFHQASLLLLESAARPREALDINITGTYNVFRAAIDCGVRKVVYASSASVFGEPLQVPVRESHPYNNTTFYGATKVACEQLALSMAEHNALRFIGLRYYNIYGPRQSPKAAYAQVLPRWMRQLDQGQPLSVYGDGSQTMDLIHVADIVRCNIAAMQTDVHAEFFNVGTGVATTVLQAAVLLQEVTGQQVGIDFIPHDINLVKQRRSDTTKCHELLGFSPSIRPTEGLHDYVEWYRSQRRGLHD